MRCSPLGILAADYDGLQQLDDIIRNDTLQTHSHPVALCAVKVYVYAIKELIEHGDRDTAYATACQIAKEDDSSGLVSAWLEAAKYVDSCKTTDVDARDCNFRL